MYGLKKIGKVFRSKFVGPGPSSYKKRIYRAAVSQRLRNTAFRHTSPQCPQPLALPQTLPLITHFSAYNSFIHVSTNDSALNGH